MRTLSSGDADRSGFEIIDLSMRLSDDTPVYPGDPCVRIEATSTFEVAGFFNTRLTLGAHNGTHIDAEGHMIPGGRMLNEYPLSCFHGRGVLLDARDGSPEFDLRDIGVDADCIVLLWTGISDARHEPDYYSRVPDLTMDLVEHLIAAGVKMVGVDAGSIDAEPFEVHKALLSGGVLIAENLVGLSALASRPFTVWALPLNVGVEASPARVVAYRESAERTA
jgi:arylformamidase